MLVVPLGVHAKESLKHSPPFYGHPDSWRAGYRYLVTLWRNEVKGVYEVLESVTTNPVGDAACPAPNNFPKPTWETLASSPGYRVSVLKPLDETDQRLGRFLNKRYSKKGPQGRGAAFTQTHRYLEHPEDLGDYFA